jgi:hypothetical protein
MKRIAMTTGMIVLACATLHALPVTAEDEDNNSNVVAVSTLLNGLSAGALFPYIDSTPGKITRAHIAVTDTTSTCSASGGTAPSNIQILVGVAGGTLVNVMTAATNTGIKSDTQCVFHVTIVPGTGVVPSQVTDIVVKNAGSAALTGLNTITVSAKIR